MPETTVIDKTGTPVATEVAYEPGPARPPVRRSFMRQLVHDTFTQFGARLGALWVAILAFFGCFAPLVANTHPILMKTKGPEGGWSSPMWQNLSPLDILLIALGITVIVTAIVRRSRFADVVIALAACVIVVAPLAYTFKTAPETVNFQKYRDLERAGGVDFIWRTIIPFSPTDRLRDMPEHRLTGPFGTHNLETLTRKDGVRMVGVVRQTSEGYDVDDHGAVRKVKSAEVESIVPQGFRSLHWLGTEVDGADLLSRMLHATRIALSIGLISTTISVTIGIIIGGLMGYFVGWVDLLGMRLVEVFEAIPSLLVLITVMVIFGRNIYYMMIVIGLLSWTGTARFIRAEFLRLRKQDFVQAAIAVGLPQWRVIFRHVVPNALTPVLVTATFGVASAILIEATLSFLGLGLIDEPSWGSMLNQARSGGGGFVWWMAIFPGLAIFLTVYAYALIGDAARDALDPKLKKRD